MQHEAGVTWSRTCCLYWALKTSWLHGLGSLLNICWWRTVRRPCGVFYSKNQPDVLMSSDALFSVENDALSCKSRSLERLLSAKSETNLNAQKSSHWKSTYICFGAVKKWRCTKHGSVEICPSAIWPGIRRVKNLWISSKDRKKFRMILEILEICSSLPL